MLGSGKTRAVRALVTASSPRSRDADLYRRYAAALYRQALLTRGDPTLAEHVVGDVIVDECALAPIPERARYRLTESVLRRCHQLAAGPAWQVRRPGQRPRARPVAGLGPVRAGGAVALYPRGMAAFWHAVMRRPASSSAAVAEDGSLLITSAAGGQ
jgi:hypothetical protein